MSAAWLLPCDRSGTVSPGWLDDDPERRERVEGFRPNAVAEFEGGRRVARLPGEEQPHVWIGTIVLGAEQIIYLGNGEWQPLADAPNHPNSSVGERSGMFPDGVRLVRLLVG